MFRIGILGFWHVHAQDYAREAEGHPGVELAAVWDDDAKRGRTEANRRNVPFYQDLDELLAEGDIEGFVVTTSTAAHTRVTPAAVNAGKHVFTEKVIAPSLSEAQDIAQRVDDAGVTLVVSLPRLYTGYTQAISEALAADEVGEPTYLRIRVSHDGALPNGEAPRGWLPERFFDSRESGGGVTIDFGAHPLYLAAHLLGMPEEVNASYGRFTGRSVEDNSVVALLFANGTIGTAEASFLGASVPFSVEAHGTRGSLLYDSADGLKVRRDAAGWEAVSVPADGESPFERWVDLCSEGRKDPENVRAALQLSALAEAANLSANDARRVRLAEVGWRADTLD